jgi:hypothetical protein
MITGIRVAPFFAETDGTIVRNRIVSINPVTNIATYVEDGGNAIALSDAVDNFHQAISYLPKGDMSQEVLLTLGGPVTKGDMITSDDTGRGVTTADAAEAVAQALSSGVLGQTIAVRLFIL